jgi:hypothetical protein
VDDALVVHVAERVRDLGEDVSRLTKARPTFLLEEGPGVGPVDELQEMKSLGTAAASRTATMFGCASRPPI